MTVNELLSRQQSLSETRSRVQQELETALRNLDAITDVGTSGPEATAQLVALQGKASALTATAARLDRSLEDVDRQLQVAQEAERRAELLDRIEDAAALAVAATAEEQRRYADVVAQFERLLGSVLAAAEAGRAGRQHLRGLLKEAAPALTLLGNPTTFSAAREAEAKELEAALAARGVNLARALEPTAALRYGHILWPLAHEWSRSRSHPLEAA